jgi:hypothetical protein
MIVIKVTLAGIDGPKELGKFTVAKLPRPGDHLRLPEGSDRSAREWAVLEIVHLAFEANTTIGSSDPKVEVRLTSVYVRR